jgi:multiple sugar transport system substrate-binding protein
MVRWKPGVQFVALLIVFFLLPAGLNELGLAIEAQDKHGGVLQVQAASAPLLNFRIYWWGNQLRHERTLKALDAYKVKNPSVSFTAEYTSFSHYWDKLAVQAASGTMPDIIQMDPYFVQEYAQRGALYDLTPLSGKVLKLDDMNPALLTAGTVDGKVYAVCNGANVQVYHVNTALLAEAGLSLPADNWTWITFVEYSTKVKQKLGSNVWFSTDFSTQMNFFEYWVRQRGLQGIYNGTQFAMTEKEPADWWKFWKNLRDAGLIPPADVTAATTDTDLQTFPIVKRQAVVHRGWSNEYTRYSKVVKDPLAMISLPRGGKAEGNYPRCSQFFSVSARSQAPAEAAKFINWVIRDPQALDILRTDRGTPVFKQGREMLKRLGLNQYDAKVFAVEDKILSYAASGPQSPPKGGGQVRDLFIRTGQEVMFGRKTPEQAAKDFMTQATKILREAASKN